MALFKKNPTPVPAPAPDKGAAFRKALLASLPDETDEPDELTLTLAELEIETELENEMSMQAQDQDSGKTIPAGLIDRHLEQIKDLSGKADNFEAEAKRLLTLAKEHRLGVKALEAANQVLQNGTQPPERVLPGEKPEKASFNLPAATGLSEAGQ